MPLLAALPEDRLRALWSHSLPRRHHAGEVILSAGEPAEYLLLLLRGRVSVATTTAAGRVVRFGDWTGPCAPNKVAVIDGRGHTATLTAVTHCTVRSLPRSRFEELVDDVPAVRRHVLRLLAQVRRDGLVEVTRHTVAVLAPELLALRATESGPRTSYRRNHMG
ncbi:Crp/Fnr family transcriptional regulator [Streptomyces sp. NBC_00162]|uniref:Crp/Fnr family transcriptional regulator n=1 Tax=Streptomyces sp. NBC_00162 TaxID=2903629 RepID=UPI00214B464D|nr:cyclic nucleotide-binding domain-containing protein [Streptomyces sp. NBC_00162]UUU43869.1 cyclic nucleotide-binding domain-containing protein [Streptomyces sp. NBC_00162]